MADMEAGGEVEAAGRPMTGCHYSFSTVSLLTSVAILGLVISG